MATKHESLAEQLDHLREELQSRIPTQVWDLMQRKTEELEESGMVLHALGVGDRAPDFELPDYYDQPVRLTNLLKDGPVVLSFYRGGWCPYCKALMPQLQTIADEYEGELTIYAINFRDDGDPQAFMEQNGYTFTLLLNGGAVAEQYEIWGTPGVLVFDENNRQTLNLYDVITDVDAELAATEGLSHRGKAERKAPAWAAAIEAAL